MKNHRKFLLLIIGLLICSLLFILIQIYAKYLSSSNGSTSMNIANWNIKVNTLSIKSNTDISNSLVPVFPGNEHIAPNIIAPTAEGYFDLNFDYSEADVSFKYDIKTSVNPDSSVQDLIATGYSIDDGPIVKFKDPSDIITNTISLSNPVKTTKIRIYILWNDDESTQSMTNSDDYQSTLSNTPALFDVNVSFTQVAQ